MRLIDRHIGRSVLGGTLVALFALGALDLFFAFMNEVEIIGRGSYGLWQAVVYVLLTVPRRLYELFPTAVLLGALLGLGTLAANGEFIAMRAAGASIAAIARSALKAGFAIMVAAVLVGEFVAPAAENQAQNLRAGISGKDVHMRDGALWVRDGNRFVRVGTILPGQRLRDIEVYETGPDRRLTAAIRAESSEWRKDAWVMRSVERSVFTDEGVVVEKTDQERWPRLIVPEIFDVLVVEPHQMSAWALSRYVLYLRENALDAAPYELAFWVRFTTPLSSLVMLLLALPFVFGPRRSGSAGQRLFVGIVIGIGFFILSRTFNHVGLVYGFSPIVSAFAPLLIFLSVSLFALRRIR